MKFNKMFDLTNKLEEVKESLSNWNLDDVEVNFEVVDDELVVTFTEDYEYLAWELLDLPDSRQAYTSVWLKF